MKTQVITSKAVNEVKALPALKKVETPVKEQKADIMSTIEQFKVTPPNAEEKILRAKQFDALSERYQALKEKSNDLKLFEAGNDQTSAKIVLKNSAGFEFEIKNSNVIEKVQNCLQEELEKLLRIAEVKILEFSL